MPKAKGKKKTENKTSLTKSVFLYGYPNKEKLKYLKRLQGDYTDAVNYYIGLLSATNDYLFEILCNRKKDSAIRTFEKENRVKKLKSALSQTAFDDAFTKLSNRLKDIKSDCNKMCNSIFTKSNILFVAAIKGKDKNYMLDKLVEVRNSYKDEKKIDQYDNLIKELSNMADEEFKFQTDEAVDCYFIFSAAYKIPEVKHTPVRLDSRAQNFVRIEKAKNISSPYVLSIIDIHNNGQRIDIPLITSRNSERRILQYDTASTIDYTIIDNKIKVSVAFEKKTKLLEPTDYIGVDTGITDMFYTSENKTFGSFSKLIEDYDKNVLPIQGELNKLRNKKRKLKKILKRNLPQDVKQNIIAKIDRLETNIKKCKKLDREFNKHEANQRKLIKDTVKDYMASLPNKSTVTVLELLDIKDFHKWKKMNRNLSNFARGQLQKTLMDTLNWHGYSFIEVEPTYTSQVCPICFNLDSKNRSESDKKDFTCTCCGFHDDADHVGSLNIRERALDEEIIKICENYHGKQRQAELKKYYQKKHEEYLKLKEVA